MSKGLKFVPTANKIDRAKLKTELEEYGRKLRPMWHFINDEKPFQYDKFRPKSTLNSSNKDTIKGADKRSAVVVWDREDYLKEAYK